VCRGGEKNAMKSLQESTLGIVGLGLMGGSLAMALRAGNACRSIIGVTRNARTRHEALERGVVDVAGGELGLVADADVIVLATPVHKIIEQLPQVGLAARAGAVVMDFGSTKRDILRAMQDLPAHVEPIGAHPMCGKETSGFESADADLYRKAVFVLTPLERTSPETLALAQSLAAVIGARPLVLEAERHDRMVAAVSHLPFVLASTLMTTADELAQADDLLYTLAASGFRDTSRLAASDTTMMLDILLTNRANVAAAIRASAQHLRELADLIESADEITLRSRLERAASSRRRLRFEN
jgi:prephenate dehydrogenase